MQQIVLQHGKKEIPDWATDGDSCPCPSASGAMTGSGKPSKLASEQESQFKCLEDVLVGAPSTANSPEERHESPVLR